MTIMKTLLSLLSYAFHLMAIIFQCGHYTKGKIYYNEYNTAINHYDVKKDITLYAGWSKNRVIMSYKIMFDATTNGGTGGQINPVMVKTGERLPEITSAAPERTGFTFVGWYDSVNNGKV